MSEPPLSTALRCVAPPKQVRSEQTLRRILDAAERLIEEKGPADASIPEIVRRAGSSVGGFYARFRDKDELLRALEERFFQQLYQRLEELIRPGRWEGARIAEIVRPCVVELVTTMREREALLRCFLVRAARDPEIFEDGLRFRRRVSEAVGVLLLERRDEIRHPDPELAVDLGIQIAFGLVQQAAILGEIRVGRRSLSDPEIVDELVRNFLSYLGVVPVGESNDAPATRREP